jgi:DNA-binding GntR family transcriptional regulator
MAPGVTLDQYTAVVDARLAVEKDVAAKAVAGDPPAALRAVEAIKGASRR